MKLYFGSTVTAVTTIMIVILIAFIALSVCKRAGIQFWGRRCAFLLIYGLVICCFAAARDGLDKTIQNAVDGSCKAGLFSLVSVPNIIGCIGALLIIISATAVPFAKSQHTREIWFYIMSGGIAEKILSVEAARIFAFMK